MTLKEILSNLPKHTKMWSPSIGYCIFIGFSPGTYCIEVKAIDGYYHFTEDGKLYIEDEEPSLFL